MPPLPFSSGAAGRGRGRRRRRCGGGRSVDSVDSVVVDSVLVVGWVEVVVLGVVSVVLGSVVTDSELEAVAAATAVVVAGDHDHRDDQADDDGDQAGDRAAACCRAGALRRAPVLGVPSSASGPRASVLRSEYRVEDRDRCPRSRIRFAALRRSPPGCCRKPPSGSRAGGRRRECRLAAGARRRPAAPRPARRRRGGRRAILAPPGRGPARPAGAAPVASIALAAQRGEQALGRLQLVGLLDQRAGQRRDRGESLGDEPVGLGLVPRRGSGGPAASASSIT